jgi:two-component system phosphate regulon sensor histidine kinase PhoR
MSRSEYEDLRTAFTAAVSHELRTPLARLVALLDTAELPGADLPQLLRQAREQVDEMTELVDDILFLSELEQGREVVALGETEAAPVLRDVVAERAERAETAGIRLDLRIEDETLLVPLRRRMLRTVAENLVENAIRYAGEGATCVVSLRREDGRIVLEAADDGAGVPEEDAARLFERFFRSDRARTTRGSGLGLAIVKHVVETAGGHVEARGAKGRGLDVRCVLPSA